MPGTQYVGTAGQLAVMSELSLRGYNVAIPQIDKGDDVFVVNDASGAMARVQVKTSRGKNQAQSRAYQFRVRETAIQVPQNPELHFVFVCRAPDRWRFVVVPRQVLHNYVVAQNVGTASNEYRVFPITLHNDGTATCSGVHLQHHLEDWTPWPELA